MKEFSENVNCCLAINNNRYNVDKEVFDMFKSLENQKDEAMKQVDIHLKALNAANKMLSESKYLIAKILRGEKIDNSKSIWLLGRELAVEAEVEAKHGVSRWVFDNWQKLSGIKCDCGNMIHFDTVRKTNQLICSNCIS